VAAVCIVNLEDIRTFARMQGERLPEQSNREWLERAILRHVIGRSDCLHPSAPSRVEIALAHVARAVATGETTFRFSPSTKLPEDVALVVDWLAGLQERDPRLAGKLRRITFAQALGMSERWHDRLRKEAKRQVRTIPADPFGAPVVLAEPSLGKGWSWVWLISPEARKAEGKAMGHCVGSGGYESLWPSEAILSLRDQDGIPHVTLHLDGMEIRQVAATGNAKVPERYAKAVDEAHAVIGARLFVNENPARAVGYGRHRRDGISIYSRRGVLHREDGPAVTRPSGTKEWYHDGRRHREDGPAIEWADGGSEWYCLGKRHREDGPAIERANGTRGWYYRGSPHREDGPAIERADGTKEWYLDGKRVFPGAAASSGPKPGCR
jgi:hypothetical protein